ncbi:hypothetical protein MMC25_001813 [Agyrium rufum]|nr:hypothetical protein [Agyrium rufum]
MESPWRKAADSPSRQLLWELQQIHLNDRTSFYAQLDKATREREEQHRAELAAAAAEHDRIRRNAELEREKLELRIQEEQSRREAQAREELDRRRREKVEREIEEQRQEVRRAKAAEEEALRVRQAHEARAKALEEESQAERARADAAAKENAAKVAARAEELERAKDKEKAATVEAVAKEAAAKEAARQTLLKPPILQASTPNATQPPRPAQAPIPASSSSSHRLNPERVVEHNRYLDIHRSLKQLRRDVAVAGQQNKALKTQVGDMRRKIKKCMGQLTEGKGQNKQSQNEIHQTLNAALTIEGQPMIPVAIYLYRQPTPTPSDPNGPAILLFLLNIFAKAIVAQLTAESGVSLKTADPIGILASQVFGTDTFRWNGSSLIDILLAKMHAACPVLFGVHGPESTTGGKKLLGWQSIKSISATGTPQISFISEGRHTDRMTGLGAGFAAIALRNYERSTKANPYPASHWWRALHDITTGTDPADATATHFMVLKAMIEGQEKRILELFGKQGLLAMRYALVIWPGLCRAMGTARSPAAKGVLLLPEVFGREKKIWVV